jgi:threonyl-tRNA synthetase
MKFLAIHADFIEFNAKKKAFKQAEEDIATGKQKVDECLVIFTAVEKRDEENMKAVLTRYEQEVRKIAEQVGATKIVLYPYAHLSNSLASPATAMQFLLDAHATLATQYDVIRAPFGWYKAFTVSCKGHALSELSREFGPTDTSPATLKREGKDEAFELYTDDLTAQQKVTYSTAALCAAAVVTLYEDAKIGSIDFYHDQSYVDIANVKLRQDDLNRITKKMKELRGQDLVFAKLGNEQVEGLQAEIKEDTEGDVYMLGNIKLVPLYKEPFIYSTKEINAIKLLNTSCAYWKNNDSNQQLTRINCIGFRNQEELQAWKKQQEEAENRSHIKLGKELGLFVISDLVGAGLPLLTAKGNVIRREIINYLWELHAAHEHHWVWTPHIAKDVLYKTSGHWDKFGDELFKVRGKSNDHFVMKPMNCPHHMQIFDSMSLSYRDMPVRCFEPATIYRDEKSGQLLGLSRVRAITQDDGHIFCRVSQIKEEVSFMVNVVRKFYATLGMEDYWVSFSVRGDDRSKYLGTNEVWDTAENALEDAAKHNQLNYKRIEGEAAFYGPKLDFIFTDALGREWQLATIQCDFNLPERFNLSFMNEESVKERPVVIHRAISGSIERFMSVLIEHFAGKFPLWLSPVQVKVVTVNDSHNEHAYNLAMQMKKQGVRIEVDDRVESIGKKVRDAQLQHVNYILTIGEKEVEKNVLAVRDRNGNVEFDVPTENFITNVVKERDERRC